MTPNDLPALLDDGDGTWRLRKPPHAHGGVATRDVRFRRSGDILPERTVGGEAGSINQSGFKHSHTGMCKRETGTSRQVEASLHGRLCTEDSFSE